MTLISRLVFVKDKKAPTKLSIGIKTDEISIVIPVKDNQLGIDTYLRTFFETHSNDNFPREIIIVDNNSNPAITIQDKFHEQGIKLKLIQCLKPGPAAARNAGANSATGNWLLFNDSDCIPTASLLIGYKNADNLSVAYAGNIKASGNDRLSRYYDSQEILIPLKTYDESGKFVPQYLITANSLIWKPAFDQINGFNEKIGIAGGEDVDLGLRLSEIGTLAYAFDSVAIHNFSDGIAGFIKRFIRYGKGNRLVEELWQTDLKPKLFRPNKRTLLNELFAKFQYLALTIGYLKQARRIKKYGW